MHMQLCYSLISCLNLCRISTVTVHYQGGGETFESFSFASDLTFNLYVSGSSAAGGGGRREEVDPGVVGIVLIILWVQWSIIVCKSRASWLAGQYRPLLRIHKEESIWGVPSILYIICIHCSILNLCVCPSSTRISCLIQIPSSRCDLCGGGSVGYEVLEGGTWSGVDTQLLFLEGLPISCEGTQQHAVGGHVCLCICTCVLVYLFALDLCVVLQEACYVCVRTSHKIAIYCLQLYTPVQDGVIFTFTAWPCCKHAGFTRNYTKM